MKPLEEREIEYAIVGTLALHGASRTTTDVDLLVPPVFTFVFKVPAAVARRLGLAPVAARGQTPAG